MCSENKGAGQLRGYRPADLRRGAVFAHAKNSFSLDAAQGICYLYELNVKLRNKDDRCPVARNSFTCLCNICNDFYD